jgi:CBS domain-containing protein
MSRRSSRPIKPCACLSLIEHSPLQNLDYRPVIDESRVVGVVSPRDLLKSALAAVLGYGEMAQKTLLNTLRVKDAMSEPAIVISPEATIKEAVQLMQPAPCTLGRIVHRCLP